MIAFWRDAGVAFEHAAEILHIRNAALQSHRLDGQVCDQQELLRPIDAAAVHVFGQRHPDFFFEQRGEVAGVDIDLPGKRFQTQIRCQIGIDIGDRLPDRRGIAFQPVFRDQMAIVVNDLIGKRDTLLLAGHLLDDLDTMVGIAGNMNGMDARVFSRFPQKRVDRDAEVLSVTKRIGEALGKWHGRQLSELLDGLTFVSGKNSHDDRVFHSVAILDVLCVQEGLICMVEIDGDRLIQKTCVFIDRLVDPLAKRVLTGLRDQMVVHDPVRQKFDAGVIGLQRFPPFFWKLQRLQQQIEPLWVHPLK